MQKGQHALALSYADDLVRFGEASGDPHLVSWGLTAQGIIFLTIGPLDEAERRLLQARDLCFKITSARQLAEAVCALGRCFLLQGKATEAETMIASSVELIVTNTLNTLLLRVSVLSKLHQDHQVANPCRAPSVRELLIKTRRGYAKRGALPRKKAALTKEPLEALLATCDDSLVGLRDRALLLFAFSSGGRRRSEVVSACVENTPRVPGGFLFTLTHSKTNQLGLELPENDKLVAGRAADALDAWLRAAGIESGALFRRVRRGSVIGEPLAAAAVYDIVKRRCLLAGIEGDFSAHSLRSGFVTESARQAVPLPETMAMTGHRSASSVLGYYRQKPADSRASRLMDSPDEPS